MQYKLLQVSAGMSPVLEQAVQEHLDAGWELNGEFYTVKVDNYHVLIQSVVKHASS